MADAVRFELTTTTVGYQLDLPTNAAEVSKAISWATRDYAEHHGLAWGDVPDDALSVRSDGDQLVISWVKRNEASR